MDRKDEKEFSLWEMEKRKQERQLGDDAPEGANRSEEDEGFATPISNGFVSPQNPTARRNNSRSHISHTKMADLWQSAASKRDMDVHKFWEVIKRYRLIIGVIALTICGINMFFTYRQPDEFKSTATLRVAESSLTAQYPGPSYLATKMLKDELDFPDVRKKAADNLRFKASYFHKWRSLRKVDLGSGDKTADENKRTAADLFETLCEKYATVGWPVAMDKKQQQLAKSVKELTANLASVKIDLGELSSEETLVYEALETPKAKEDFLARKQFERYWNNNVAALTPAEQHFFKNVITDKELEIAKAYSANSLRGKVSVTAEENGVSLHITAREHYKNLVSEIANATAQGLIFYQRTKLGNRRKEVRDQIGQYQAELKKLQAEEDKISLEIRDKLAKGWDDGGFPFDELAVVSRIIKTPERMDDLIAGYRMKKSEAEVKSESLNRTLESTNKRINEILKRAGAVVSENNKPMEEAVAEAKAAKLAMENLDSELRKDPEYIRWLEQKVALESSLLTLRNLYKKEEFHLIRRKKDELTALEAKMNAPVELKGSIRAIVFKRLKSDYKNQLMVGGRTISGTVATSPELIQLMSRRNYLDGELNGYAPIIKRYTKLLRAALLLRAELAQRPEIIKISEKIVDLREKRRSWVDKESQLVGEAKVGLSVVNKARPPESPFAPNRMQNSLIGLIVGLIVALGVAFLLEYMDNTIKTPLDIRKELNLNTLGIIPKWGKKDVSAVSPDDPKSIVAEVFGVLRNNIRYSSRLFPEKMLLVASALKGEGKSYVAGNIAVSFSMEGTRTVLVNADLRKTAEYKNIQPNNGFKGLSDYLEGHAEVKDVVSPTNVPDLYYVSSGHKVSHPAKVLRSDRMIDFLEELERTFDVVIVDVPAVLPVVDTTTFSNRVRGVIMVISAGSSPTNAVKHAVDRLRHVKSPIVGAILNNAVDTNVTAYYGDTYYYYEQEPKKLYRSVMKKLRGF